MYLFVSVEVIVQSFSSYTCAYSRYTQFPRVYLYLRYDIYLSTMKEFLLKY